MLLFINTWGGRTELAPRWQSWRTSAALRMIRRRRWPSYSRHTTTYHARRALRGNWSAAWAPACTAVGGETLELGGLWSWAVVHTAAGTVVECLAPEAPYRVRGGGEALLSSHSRSSATASIELRKIRTTRVRPPYAAYTDPQGRYRRHKGDAW